MEDVQEGFEVDTTRDETRLSEESPPLAATTQDQNAKITLAAILSPPGMHTVDTGSHSPHVIEETEHQNPLHHHGLHGALFEEAPLLNTESVQPPSDEPLSRGPADFEGSAEHSPASPTLLHHGERRFGYNLPLQNRSPNQNENVPSRDAAGSGPSIHQRDVLRESALRNPQQLMKYFIDRVAPWVRVSISRIPKLSGINAS